jgi:hypothetical protein
MMNFTRIITSLLKYRNRLVWYVFAVFLFSGTALTQPVPDLNFRPPIENPAYPKGKGPVILVDEGHFNFHITSGRYVPFTEILKRDGYVVKPLNGTFHTDSLRKGNVLVIVTPLAERNKDIEKLTLPIYSAFTDEEIEAVKLWVFGGGSLFLIAEHMPFAGAVNRLAEVFGVSFSNGYVRGFRWSRSEGELPDHPIINGRSEEERVDSVSSTAGSAFRSERPIEPLLILKAGAVSYETEKVMEFTPQTQKVSVEGWFRGAVLRFGKGRVAIFGEASMFTAQLRGPDQTPQGMNEPENKGNVQFLLNIMHWLSGLLGKE